MATPGTPVALIYTSNLASRYTCGPFIIDSADVAKVTTLLTDTSPTADLTKLRDELKSENFVDIPIANAVDIPDSPRDSGRPGVRE